MNGIRGHVTTLLDAVENEEQRKTLEVVLKVMLSACLAPEPEIVIVNEPTRGIDVGAKAEIHTFLLDLAANGVGIIVFSSEMPELMKLCDRILVMRSNSIVGEVPSSEFSEQTIMRYAAVGENE